ncbi:MAG: 1-deoxy-D-xylulose-5-phosphate synthase, partial [Oscillospiraceae bacterium]|nr:1-deoxy-D-xylulose-5-phosphate synthase [Oscillospiraceae bacterium]
MKSLSLPELTQLCEEIRSYLVKTVSVTGGHLASNLGVVELTVALHKVFDLPNDKIIWDVGHQSYTHKLLTGRRDAFSTLRQKDGISGFPRPSESEYDAFIGGHSSTSISAAIGICAANKLNRSDDHVIAVIGDGAFTGGMAYEALNNAGKNIDNLIVILNYNEMSISKNVGGFARYLASRRSNPRYLRLKRGVEKVVVHIPLIGKRLKGALQSSKSAIKNLLYHSTLFEDFGFIYLGPIDGHSLPEMIQTLEDAKRRKRPVLVHVDTVKGKGYSYAEENPGAFHGISKFDVDTGLPSTVQGDCYSQAAGLSLIRLAEKNKKICVVTAAMKYGTGMQDFAHTFRDRVYDVGIAEQHAVTFCGGLASAGFVPVFAVYSSFLQRAFDQVIHDTAIDKQHVVLAIDRAGIVGEDGETHQGIFDVAFLNLIPNITIYSPCGFEELSLCLEQAVEKDSGVIAVRYPRGGESGIVPSPQQISPYQRFGVGADVLLITYGRLSEEAYQAQKLLAEQGTTVDFLKLTRLLPVEEEVYGICKEYRKVLFYEEGIR